MSICSDVFISLEEARERVRSKLMYQQSLLIESAIKSMNEFELSGYLNEDGSLYYYNIDRSIKKKKVINEKK